jgi:hypothetical protein
MLVLVDLPLQENDFLAGHGWSEHVIAHTAEDTRPCPQEQDCSRSLPAEFGGPADHVADDGSW